MRPAARATGVAYLAYVESKGNRFLPDGPYLDRRDDPGGDDHLAATGRIEETWLREITVGPWRDSCSSMW